MNSSLNSVSTCLKVVDTRRYCCTRYTCNRWATTRALDAPVPLGFTRLAGSPVSQLSPSLRSTLDSRSSQPQDSRTKSLTICAHM
jgi:hypothetical protein